LTRTALPLGILADVEWKRSEVQLMPGDILMLYTDGVTEAIDENESLFGEDRLQSVLQANAGKSADVIEGKVITAVDDFSGDAPQFDDITLMVVKRER
jgi:sigma-B regulation protein RsbU (phosphoserine phosphatase)